MTRKRSGGPAPRIDWAAVKLHYESTFDTLAQIGSEHGIDKRTISAKSIREKWERPKNLVVRRAVGATGTLLASMTEDERKTLAAQTHIEIVVQHKHRIASYREIIDNFAKDIATEPEGEYTQSELHRRVDSACKLVAAYKQLIILERQAFGLDVREEPETGLSDVSSDLLRIMLAEARARQSLESAPVLEREE